MDNNDRRRRQSTTTAAAAAYSTQQNPYSASPYSQTSASDRFRQPALPAQSPTSNPSAAAAGARGAAAAAAAAATAQSGSSSGYNYGYGAEGTQFVGQQMQSGGTALQYPAAGYSQDQQARTAQQYPQYGSAAAAASMMYNVPQQQQQQQQQTPQSPYESVQPYQPRESAALGVLTSQFGVPQQYYVAGEGGPTSAPAAAMAAQNVPTQYSGMQYTSQQSPVARGTLAPAFNPGMSDQQAAAAAQGTSQGSYSQDSYAAQQHQQGGASELDQAYARYQNVLKQTHEYIRDGRLGEAGRSLLEMSEWLVNNAENLAELTIGLVRDDQALHGERLKLWDDFNTCWLTTLQRQKEMSEDFVNTGQEPRPPENLLEYEYMETLGRELVRLCDIMEKHGLVDYQMGIWEEEIVSMLTTCLDLLEDQPRSSNGAAAQAAAASSSAARRR